MPTMDNSRHSHHLFVVRLWRENKNDGNYEWHGQVKHLFSQKIRAFESWNELILQMGALLNLTEQTGSGTSVKRSTFKTNQRKEVNMKVPTVRVVARAKVNELRTLLTSLLEPTRNEAGCVRYELLHNNSQPTDFTFVEEWQNDDAIDNHLGTSHVQAALARFPELLAVDLDMQRYSVISQ